MSDSNEEEIIKQIQNGDTRHYEGIIKKYQDRVFRYAYSKLGNYDDALEATQDIFVSVFRSLKNFRGDSKFSTWLYSITSNYCKNAKRKSRRMNVVSIFRKDNEDETELQIVDEREGIEEKVELSNTYEIATEELQKLPDDYREILVLRDIEEYSYDEIADILNISLSNVKVRIHRGRAMLKQRLHKRGLL
ncbi:MAG: RNA polymerase sigma factor [Spirochaetota bacterium]